MSIDLLSISFFLYGLVFFAGVIISICLPGFFIVSFLKNISLRDKTILSVAVGCAVLGFGAYGLGWLGLSHFMPAISWSFAAATLYIKRNKILPLIKNIISSFLFDFPKRAHVLVIIGSITQLLAVFGSGLGSEEGIAFYWLNAFDGVMHAAFIQEMVFTFPPMQPGMVGASLTNYHFWADLVMAEMVRQYHLPILQVLFQFMPIVLSTVIGYLSYILVDKWTGKKMYALLAVFFVYFAGDISYVFMWLLSDGIRWGSGAIDNGTVLLVNPPQAFAKLIFLATIYFFDHWRVTKQHFSGYIMAALAATLFGFKIYFGLFLVIGFAVYWTWSFIVTYLKFLKEKSFANAFGSSFMHFRSDYLPLLLFVVLSAAIFLPINKSSGGLIWSPLDWPTLYMGEDKIGWDDWSLRMQVYEAAGNQRSIIIMYMAAVIVFMLATYGVRLIGFIIFPQLIKKINNHSFILLFPAIIICTFIGLNFLQVSGSHNIFNFFVVSLIGLGLIAPLQYGMLLEKFPRFKIIILVVLIAVTIPRAIFLTGSYLTHYWFNTDKTVVTHDRQQMFTFLKDNTASTAILQANIDDYLEIGTPVTALFTHRYTYVGGRGILESHNQPIKERVNNVINIFIASNSADLKKELRQTPITHLIIDKKIIDGGLKVSENICSEVPITTFLITFFESSSFKVYQVVHD